MPPQIGTTSWGPPPPSMTQPEPLTSCNRTIRSPNMACARTEVGRASASKRQSRTAPLKLEAGEPSPCSHNPQEIAPSAATTGRHQRTPHAGQFSRAVIVLHADPSQHHTTASARHSTPDAPPQGSRLRHPKHHSRSPSLTIDCTFAPGSGKSATASKPVSKPTV